MTNPSRVVVSAIIPVHNRSDLVPGAIRSALAQQIDSLEVIVIDDGSTDDLRSAVAPFLPGVTLIAQPHAGPAAARNRGIEAASGRYVAFLDADDEWLPEKLAVLTGFLEAHPSLHWACSNHWVVTPNGGRRPRLRHKDMSSAGVGIVDDWFEAYDRTVTTATSGVIIRLDTLREVGGFDETVLSGHDYDLWFRTAMRYPRFAYCPRPLFLYRANLSGSVSRAGLLDDKYRVVQRHVAWEADRGLGDARRRRVVRQGLKFFRRALVGGRRDLASQILDDLTPLIPAAKRSFLRLVSKLPSAVLKSAAKLRSASLGVLTQVFD